MNTFKTLAAALGLVVMAVTGALLSTREESRSAGPVKLAATLEAPTFSRDEATGLFVGVRNFPHDETLTVPYAVDDAVDLAHRFSLDQRVGLVPPRRAVLALSGAPQKEESKERLRKLKEAGARIVNGATSGDILELLKEQAERAGTGGIFVFSIASHGFQHEGDAYILGSTSAFGSPETSLRTATIFEAASQARRSLLFIDACRERIGQVRGARPDPAAAAPHIRGMSGVQGQVIFYAAAPGQYAFDDPVNRNGVFTRAVLDGLNCEATAVRGKVEVETLHEFVDREVRRWIRDHKKKTVNPATQVSMEGETRRMPLSTCWRPLSAAIRVSVDRSLITAYGDDSKPLWRKDFGEPVVHAEAADLDADAFSEVVVALGDRIVVLDRDGKPLWTHAVEGMTLQTFTTGDLFEKKTNQILALWNDGSTSRLTVVPSDGRELSRFDYAGLLEHVAVGRPTNMHAPKIVVATGSSLLLLHPKKLDGGVPLWDRKLLAESIRGLRILDGNGDSRRDIAVTTRSGTTWFTFDGKIVEQNAKVTWADVAVRRPRR